MKIGVLALQGDFEEHITILEHLDVEVVEVRLPEHLQGLDGLIIPGGESTTIGKLVIDFQLDGPTVPIRKGKGDLGYVRWGDFLIQGCTSSTTAVRIDGYHGGTQRLWSPGLQASKRSWKYPSCIRCFKMNVPTQLFLFGLL